MEKKEIVKTTDYVQYFVEITKNSETSYKTLKSKEIDYNPFVLLDDKWEDLEALPENIILIKNITASEVDETTEETVEVEYNYYYGTYSQEETIQVKKKSVCPWCIYYLPNMKSPFRKFRREACSNPNNVIHDYVRGITLPGACIDFNSCGECRYYVEKTGIDSLLGKTSDNSTDNTETDNTETSNTGNTENTDGTETGSDDNTNQNESSNTDDTESNSTENNSDSNTDDESSNTEGL